MPRGAKYPVVTDDNPKAKSWQGVVSMAALAAMAGKPLLAGPLQVQFDFQVERPKGHFGKHGLRPSAPRYPMTRPDVLKLSRSTEDALTGVVWKDDSQIVVEMLRKAYTDAAPGAWITVEERT